MDQDTRNKLQRATQQVRRILEEEFAEQLEGTFDVLPDGKILPDPGKHLDARQRLTRRKLVDAIEHIKAGGKTARQAVEEYIRHAAFTILNRFVALRMLEARDLVQECVSKGDDSSGFKEFCGLAPGLSALSDDGYRLFLECLCDELTVEIKVLFDRRDPTTLLWPRRSALTAMLDVLAQPELTSVWAEDETIGWVYQYFNDNEERTKMRAESQVPRNSRELAVRNQFFTPRYVVQFLTDNTVGRTWYEMMQGDTQLAHLDYLVRRPNEVLMARGKSAPDSETDDGKLSQVEMLQHTVYVPFREKKDPRDVRILDPACGSGHFLLYAFELLVTIYEEAWSDARSATFSETGNQLRADYGSVEDLQVAMPDLILRHNLHGVDIDPRAAQIAALALWMRAQRAYNQFEVSRAERPPITKTNIVVAEPMPGDAELVEEFAASLKPAVLGDLFKKMVQGMRLAGELGSLLKIEELIAKAVEDAEEAHSQEGLFAEKIESQDFWDTADEKIIAALGIFAESTSGKAGIRRRLFAGDAAQGVALIELMRKRFDTVLMNPPFGAGSKRAKKEFEASYPRTKNDIYAAFVERGVTLLSSGCLLGAITSRTGFFLSSFQKWREEILLKEAVPVIVADLGNGVMDSAMVEAAAYCLQNARPDSEARTDFLRVVEAFDKASELRSVIHRLNRSQSTTGFVIDPRRFAAIPKSPFAYWVSDAILGIFSKCPPFLSEGREARQGASSISAFRYIRHWTEAAVGQMATGFQCAKSGRASWVPFAKGGAFARYHSDLHLVMKWFRDGREVKEAIATWREAKGWGYAWSATLNGYSNYGRPGITWTFRTTSPISFRVLPSDCIFAATGPAGFVDGDDKQQLLVLLAVTNSRAFRALVEVQLAASDAAARSYEVGVLQRTPVPPLKPLQRERLCDLAMGAYLISRRLDSCNEFSHVLCLPALIQAMGATLLERSEAWLRQVVQAEHELANIQVEIDELCFSLYGIDGEGRRRIEEDLGTSTSGSGVDCDDADLGAEPESIPSAPLVVSLLSWTVGVAFGRFDVRLGTGNRPIPIDPEPFEPLPICSPGMLTCDEGLPLVSPPLNYPVAFPADGTFVDDQGHAADLFSRSRAVFEEVFDEPEARWHEAAELVGARNQALRTWYAKEFFGYHIKQYSKSRRKAPIYWQLATPSTSYSIWCYYHRLSRDTFFRVANDYARPKVDHEERKLNELCQEAGADPSSKQRKATDAQETFVAELRSFLTEVERIAPLWNPNLNDGVIINFAPLWRLVPQNKAWQKECKSCWDKLVKGDYDWAHLAMHLWPERVVPKCITDASLAIAHGLEEDFWEQDERDRLQPKEEPEGGWAPVIKNLIDERTSPAVKSALESLLTAPAPAGNSKSRRRKATT